VKGVPLGSSFDSLKAKFGNQVRCFNPSADLKMNPYYDGGYIDQECTLSEPSSGRSIEDTFAGHQVGMTYEFHQQSLEHILVYRLSPDVYNSVLETMESKYGKPLMTSSMLQNAMGASFENKIAIWKPSGGIIVYQRYVDGFNRPSMLDFYTVPAWDAKQRFAKDRSEAAKKDM
jgi:hypothetical protein